MSEISETEMLQHEPWVATGGGADHWWVAHMGRKENGQWRSAPIGRVDTD